MKLSLKSTICDIYEYCVIMVIFRLYLSPKKRVLYTENVYIDVGKSSNVKAKLLEYIFAEKYFMA